MYEQLDPGPRTLITILCIAFSLAAATFAQQAFIQLVQVPDCFNYARQNNLPDIDNLEVSEVVIAGGRNQRHACIFLHKSTGQPVILDYAPEDAPGMRDNLQVMSMVISFLCGSFISFVGLTSLWLYLTTGRRKSVASKAG